jgi:hypothetical protein
LTKARTNADNVTADIAGITAGTGITGGGTSGTVTVTNSMATAIDAAGDLIYGTGPDAFTRLAVGTAGRVLKVNSGATAPEWSVDPTTDVVTTAGDLIYGTGADAVARLGLGTAGQVLQVNSGVTAPEWATPAAGGGMTLLSTTTLSGASTTVSSISGSHKNLLFIINGVNISTNAQFYLQSNGSVGDWYEIYGEAGGAAWTENNGNNLYPTNTALGSGNTNNAFAVLIYNYASSTAYKPFNSTGTYNTGSADRNHFSAGTWRNVTAISSMKFSTGAGTFNGGTVLTYGVS